MNQLCIIILLVAALFSCADTNSPQNDITSTSEEWMNDYYVTHFDEMYAEFKKEKSAWEALEIDHYRFTIKKQYPPEPITVTVYPDRDPETTPKEYGYTTITELYEHADTYIRSYINSPEVQENGWRIRLNATYSGTYHYPTMIWLLCFPPPKEPEPGEPVYPSLPGGMGASYITSFEDLRGK